MSRNYELYYKKMTEALEEKIDYIIEDLRDPKENNTKFIVDIGCADGALIKTLSQIFPNKTFIGVELENIVKMLKKENTINNIYYMTTEEFLSYKNIRAGYYKENHNIIFSSVLHEMFSFEDNPMKLFDKLTKNASKIYIRDMFFTDTGFNFDLGGYYEKDDIGYLQVRGYSLKMSELYNRDYYNHNKCISEFLLKQRYRENWEEEIKEFYFSTPYKELNEILELNGFKNIKFEPYMNQYLLDAVYKETGNKLNKYTTTTHIKLVYSK